MRRRENEHTTRDTLFLSKTAIDDVKGEKSLKSQWFLVLLCFLVGLGAFNSWSPGFEESLREEGSFVAETFSQEHEALSVFRPEPLTPSAQKVPPLISVEPLYVGTTPIRDLLPLNPDESVDEARHHEQRGVEVASQPALFSASVPTLPAESVSLNISTPIYHHDGGTSRREELWRISLGAAVPRGAVQANGKVGSRLASYESKRKGPSRHDGKAWKAGEAGCPEKPKYAALEGGALVQGDERLTRIHFVHPPKSGGTTFGQVVIAASCELNSAFRDSLDCCSAPADWCAENCEPIPDCKAIYGCSLCHCHHIPRLHRMADAHYSVTIIRHPMTRYISGYFYRAHSPNWDRFNIRPGIFSKHPTYPFKFSFDDYLAMPEYHNILVKMFSRDAFPYFNATLTQQDLDLSIKRLDTFVVVGLNEAYDASVQLLLALLGVTLRDDQIHLPAAMTSTYSGDHEKFKAEVRDDHTLAARIQDANSVDAQLFEWSVDVFCKKLCAKQLIKFDKRGVCVGYC
mmetsp:Transcript_45679/g.92208  ORF Transcript_45679/g.92208 Transcript_45679/m.92208 type:complete len:515 (+) Transcript_45679:73-1617(+)